MLTARLPVIALIAMLGCSLPAQAGSSEERARRLMNALGCKACHSFERSGSNLAPPLDRVGERYNQQQLKDILSRHRDQSISTGMPSYATTPDEDLIAILQFLAAHK